MNTKLQELTGIIYQEGVEKGKAEAAAIIAAAQAEADEILQKAALNAAEIEKNALDKAAELKKNTASELKLFARQTVDALKSEISTLIAGNVASDAVKAAVADPGFMQKVILNLVEKMAANQQVTIEAKDAESLQKYFAAHARHLLDKGIEIKQVAGVKTEFAIIPAEGGYKLTFGEKELESFFQSFLRPGLVEILF